MSFQPGNERPWPAERVEATLNWDREESRGDLMFTGPDGHFAAIPVTHGNSDEATKAAKTNVWHIETRWDMSIESMVAVVSPSIHFIGHFHTPSPVEFLLTEVKHER